MNVLRPISATAVLLALAWPAAYAQTFSGASLSKSRYFKATLKPKNECVGLADLKLPELVKLNVRAESSRGGAPAYCRVSGQLDPEIAFEVSLPAAWNGRFYMIGNGGLAGQGPDDAGRGQQREAALAEGFAFATTNTGHDARKEPGGTFVLSNPQKAIDYAYRAVHLTATTAKEIVNRYYGRPAAHSYWNSCSNGGRQGLLEAERYPQDFDGIVANAPWIDQTGFTIGALWNQRALTETPISADKMALVARRVMAKCDAVDGLKDGLIDDPRQCSFNVAKDVPRCARGTDTAACLTPAQAAAIQKVYDGPSSRGKQLFPGYMLGSEALVQGRNGSTASGWLNLILPARPSAAPADFSLGEGVMRYLAFQPPKPNYDYRTFDFDHDTGLLERWGKIANATNPDLHAFRERGGKLILTHGWADTILQPLETVHFYEQAVKANAPSATDFMRLFMIPGMAHCAGGIGPDQKDASTAVIDWVEKGVAPSVLIAKKIVDGKTTRSRPLCPYPDVARYKGEGSIDDAANFECRAP
ncbi:MAG TPA: tannase/feruloyl esterase family alpha/beta hydrolase [Gammaproteobacteria bacterium]|nr:tannase/feruloyl esterase family alpha/beta hydrolase [Gammaproteobacteria bacterium]